MANQMLPPHVHNADAAAVGDTALAPIKFDQAVNPEKYGLTFAPGGETEIFLSAVDRGFLPKTVDGYISFLYYMTLPTGVRLGMGLFEWSAFLSHIRGVPFALIAESVPSYPAGWGAALEVEYGQPLPPPRPSLPPPNYGPRVLVETPDFIVTKSGPAAPFARGLPIAPGDGRHFPMIAWRIRSVTSGGGEPQAGSFSPFVRFGGPIINNTSSEKVIVEFIEDMTAAEQAAILAAPQGGPPPFTNVDVIAAPNSTPFNPVTIPAGSVPTNPQPPRIIPTQPSGSVPIPTGSTAAIPGVRPWVDAAPPDLPRDVPVSGNIETPRGADMSPTTKAVIALVIAIAAFLLLSRVG